MATFTWTSTGAGRIGDWTVGTNWAGGSFPNSSSDQALLPGASTGNKSPYTITVGGTDSIAIGTVQLAGNSQHSSPLLSVAGILNAGTVSFSSGGGSVLVNSGSSAGGLLEIGKIASTITEAITISGTAAHGGTLELGSATAGTSTVSYDFQNNGASVKSDGVIDYQSFTAGTTITQTITNVGWGDQIVLGTASEFNGDTLALNNGTLTLKSGTTVEAEIIGVTLANGAALVLNQNTVEVTCYVSGTRIRTPSGDRRVETLRPGAPVSVLDNGAIVTRPVKWLGHRRIDLAAHPRPQTALPIRIRAGAFADGAPAADLLLAPDHAVFVEGRLIAVRQLLNGASIVQETSWTAVDYYHVELDRHAILLAEGLPAESYLDTGNRGFFSNSGEPVILHPDLTEARPAPSRESGACAPFATDEATVRPVWQSLADRAAALGLRSASTAHTTDPALHLAVNHRTAAPVFAKPGLYVFALPPGVKAARLASRAAPPTAVRPWLDDRRELGVAVKRITVRADDDAIDIPLDGPLLTEGWWTVERSGDVLFRWTTGNARLELPASDGCAMLEIHLHGSAEYPLKTAISGAEPTLTKAA